MRRYHLCVVAVLFAMFGCGQPSADLLADGDIVFQTSRSSQSAAIQMATHSKYSHVGIIFLQDGTPYVFEAARIVQYTPLEQWIANGEGAHYVVKRLRDADSVLTSRAVQKLKQAASRFQGKPYDPTFEWSDDRIYCSELAWKTFDRGLGVRIGRLKQLRDFDLSNAVVKTKMKERYGDHIPLDEIVISPGDIFSSERLITVAQN